MPKKLRLTTRRAFIDLNKTLKSRDDEILQLGKKIMKIEQDLDDKTEGLLAAGISLEEAEKQQLINEDSKRG